MNFLNRNKGITLIALVITIIVLLILSAVSIATLIGENGILTQTQNARKNTTEGTEKEQVKIAYMSLMASNMGKNISAAELQEELNKEIGDGVAKVSDTENIKIRFVDTKNVYIIKNGTVENYEPEAITDVYVALYTDGTLVFSNNESDIEDSKVSVSYGEVGSKEDDWYAPWHDNSSKITSVNIINKIVPKNIASWFSNLHELVEINNLTNMNTENVTSMKWMFCGCESMTSLDLSSLNTSNVTDMSGMFSNDYPTASMKLTEIVGIEDFDTGMVTDMAGMFEGCARLEKLDLSRWDTSNVADMSYMFCDNLSLTSLDLSSFDTVGVTDMSGMFGRSTSLIGGKDMVLTEIKGIDKFDFSNVTKMDGMFYRCSSLTLDCSSWNVQMVTSYEKFNENATNVIAPTWKN